MSQYSDLVLADTPLLYWRLNDTTTTAADSSGNGRTGTYNGGATQRLTGLVQGGDGSGSTFFDATNDFVLSAALLNQSQCTVECWFEYDGVAPASGTYWSIAGFAEGDGGTTSDKVLYINSSNELEFYVFDGAPKTAATTGTGVPPGIIYVAGTSDGSNVRVYLNGIVGATAPAATGSFTGYTNPNVLVGLCAAKSVASGRKAGRRAEFAVYSSALSAAKIAARYAAGRGQGMWPQVGRSQAEAARA